LEPKVLVLTTSFTFAASLSSTKSLSSGLKLAAGTTFLAGAVFFAGFENDGAETTIAAKKMAALNLFISLVFFRCSIPLIMPYFFYF
jgi:hypothetical protein